MCRTIVIIGGMLLIALLLAAGRTPASAPESHAESVLLTLSEQVELAAKEAGAIERLAVREGDLVEAGQLLATIEDDEAAMAAEKAEQEWNIARSRAENDTQLRFARKSSEVAAAEYTRATESVEKFRKSISETEMDQLRLAAEKTELEIEQAEHDQTLAQETARLKEIEHKSAQARLMRHRITAPFAGMVVEVKKQRGEWVNPGDAVVRLVRLDRLRAEAFLPARDAAPGIKGAAVVLHVDAPGQKSSEFAGRVVFVAPEINPVNGQVRVWAEIENTDLRLRAGQQAAMTILLQPKGLPARNSQVSQKGKEHR